MKKQLKKLIKTIDELQTVVSEDKLPKYGYGTGANEYFDSGNSATVRNQVTKDFGVAGDVSTPTYGGGSADESKRLIKKIGDMLFRSEESIDLDNEARVVIPKTGLQKKILSTIEHFEEMLNKELEDEQIIKSFIKGYQRLALLGLKFGGSELDKLYTNSKVVSIMKSFDIKKSDNPDRLDKVIYVDSVAHNLHQFKKSDGKALYRELDDLAGLSKMAGEVAREDRLLILNSPSKAKDLEKMLNIEVLQKGGLNKSLSFWRLMEKAIRFGIGKLPNEELIILREWIYSKI